MPCACDIFSFLCPYRLSEIKILIIIASVHVGVHLSSSANRSESGRRSGGVWKRLGTGHDLVMTRSSEQKASVAFI